MLAPHYRTAQRMLGAVPNPAFGPADDVLRAVATEMGCGDRVHATDVGVWFGQPGVTVADPYFGGAGPARTGCIQCGACMTGCKHGAKNTLDKNYLYLAEKRGAQVRAEREVVALRCLGGPGARGEAGWQVELRPSVGFSRWFGGSELLTARQVVCAAGVLGTLPLLLAAKARGDLPDLRRAAAPGREGVEDDRRGEGAPAPLITGAAPPASSPRRRRT